MFLKKYFLSLVSILSLVNIGVSKAGKEETKQRLSGIESARLMEMPAEGFGGGDRVGIAKKRQSCCEKLLKYLREKPYINAECIEYSFMGCFLGCGLILSSGCCDGCINGK